MLKVSLGQKPCPSVLSGMSLLCPSHPEAFWGALLWGCRQKEDTPSNFACASLEALCCAENRFDPDTATVLERQQIQSLPVLSLILLELKDLRHRLSPPYTVKPLRHHWQSSARHLPVPVLLVPGLCVTAVLSWVGSCCYKDKGDSVTPLEADTLAAGWGP